MQVAYTRLCKAPEWGHYNFQMLVIKKRHHTSSRSRSVPLSFSRTASGIVSGENLDRRQYKLLFTKERLNPIVEVNPQQTKTDSKKKKKIYMVARVISYVNLFMPLISPGIPSPEKIRAASQYTSRSFATAFSI